MTYRVVNPVHETFFEGADRYLCEEWIRDFARYNNKDVVQTGDSTYRVGNFNLLIFEKEET